jgi:Zn-dependent protease
MEPDSFDFIRTFSVAAIPLIYAITLHEVAHGWVARYFGDRSAERLGRLSLNPLRHIDPLGSVIVPLMMLWMGGFVFGWARPVPVNPRALRDPRRNMIAVAAAGPAANLVMAVIWVLLYRMVGVLPVLPGGLVEFIGEMCSRGLFFNTLLAVFNMLPIPPLDGGRVLRGLVPEHLGRKLDGVEPYGLIIVIGLLVFGFLGRILGPVFDLAQEAVLWLAGVRGG